MLHVRALTSQFYRRIIQTLRELKIGTKNSLIEVSNLVRTDMSWSASFCKICFTFYSLLKYTTEFLGLNAVLGGLFWARKRCIEEQNINTLISLQVWKIKQQFFINLFGLRCNKCILFYGLMFEILILASYCFFVCHDKNTCLKIL